MPEESPILFDFPINPESALIDGQRQERMLPVVPLINTVLFPHMLTPLFVGRERSVAAIEEAMSGDRTILAVAQREPDIEEVGPADLYTIGVEAVIQRILKMPDGSISIVVQGQRRMRVVAYVQDQQALHAQSVAIYENTEKTIAVEAMMRAVLSLFEKVVKLSRTLPDDAYIMAMNVGEPGWLADLIVSTLPLDVPRRQEILETLDIEERLRRLSIMLSQELDVLELESRIHTQVQKEVDRSQREFFLREQMKAIQRELGQTDPIQREMDELRERILAAAMPERAQAKALEELERMEMMPPASPEYSVLRTYIDWLIHLPGANRLKMIPTWCAQPQRSSAITMDCRASRSGSWSSWPRGCWPVRVSSRRLSVLSGPPVWAKPRLVAQSPKRSDGALCAFRWGACTTRRRFAGTGAPISARCRGGSSKR